MGSQRAAKHRNVEHRSASRGLTAFKSCSLQLFDKHTVNINTESLRSGVP